MYCNNCGKEGHVFRTCKDPTISCGIVLLRGIYEPLKLPADPITISALMVKRKDSMAYVEFIRGKYDVSDTEYIQRLVSNMTVGEQNTIVESTFESLWTHLWGGSRATSGDEYEIAHDKFNRVNRREIVSHVPSSFKEPEWGFPKGRRMRGESDLECAVREFTEETNIPKEAYTVHEHLSFTETFTGTNNVKYTHVYFIALLQNSRLINLKQKLTVSQRREISGIDWKTLSECKKITRPHYVDRKRVISDIERVIQSAESMVSKK